MSISRLFFLIIFIILFSITAKHFLPSQEPQKPFPSQGVILAFGDSLTYGYGANQKESYPARLERLLGEKVINAGKSGELSEEGLKRLPSLLQIHKPKILLLCHGGNDILKKQDMQTLRTNLEQMIRLAQSQNIDVILISVPQFGFLQLTPPPLYDELAEAYHLAIEEDILADILHDNRYKSDYIHPNAQGYQKMAEAIEKLLRNRYLFKE
ncbi:MAG TPA: arylesterase [Sulfuricurvum sp.]|nr:arylesterase [Sulfuricurvum sp.]